MIPPLLTLLLTILLTLQATPATAQQPKICTQSVKDNTIAFFSHAPLTFSFEVPTAESCATKCADIASCRAWLYSTSGEECQLYRDVPVSRAPNPLFVSGVCDASSSASSVSRAPLGSSSVVVVPSSASSVEVGF